MIVESKMRASPSISVGTSLRGLAAAKAPPAVPVPSAAGVSTLKSSPFSRGAIFTFWA